MGPTASGKTKIAVDLVQKGGFEIISVDSAQIYQYMDIGTAKPSAKTLAIAPHRLISIKDPAETYSVAEFLSDVEREIKAIISNNNIPLLVGGSMMYFNALQKGLAILPDADKSVRAGLYKRQNTEGLEVLYKELQEKDPKTAGRIHPNDSQRILRALEVYMLSGKTLSELQSKAQQQPKYTFYNFVLMPDDRTVLHQTIEQRFDQMLDRGFVAEVENLYNRGDLQPDMPAMRSVGYRQLWRHLAGEYDLDHARIRGIIATRQLAKRQMTWLRSWNEAIVIKNQHDIYAQLRL